MIDYFSLCIFKCWLTYLVCDTNNVDDCDFSCKGDYDD